MANAMATAPAKPPMAAIAFLERSCFGLMGIGGAVGGEVEVLPVVQLLVEEVEVAKMV
jgi:hypothetical protein